jgi:ABC-type Fe2+-enterobactin transport system substrate-binding protein
MLNTEEINKKSDTLIELLTAQCADLEKLLSLAKQETLAAKNAKFLDLIDIVTDREQIGKRLETYHLQISELRSSLGENDETMRRHEITKKVIEIANLTIAQDNRSLLLLSEAREKQIDEREEIERSYRGNSAYLSEQRKGLAYDRNI